MKNSYLNNLKGMERNLVDGTISYEVANKMMKRKPPLRERIGEERTISIKKDIDVERINSEIEEVDTKYFEWRNDDICQIMLQTCHENATVPNAYFGSREFKEIEDAGYKEEDFIYPIFNMEYTNQLLKELKMFRSRLMLLKPKSCLSWHYDPSMRIHIPLSGYSDIFHIIEVKGKKVIHQIEKGDAHLMNTEVYHSGVNLSRTVERLHIVGCVNVDE